MSGNINQQMYWSENAGFQQQQQQSYGDVNFEMPDQQDFAQELSFQSFESNSPAAGYTDQPVYGNNPYLNPRTGGEFASGAVYQQGSTGASQTFDPVASEFEDEPPLLEELGINPDYILQKVLLKMAA